MSRARALEMLGASRDDTVDVDAVSSAVRSIAIEDDEARESRDADGGENDDGDDDDDEQTNADAGAKKKKKKKKKEVGRRWRGEVDLGAVSGW